MPYPSQQDVRLVRCLQQWRDFLASVPKNCRLGIVYHGDADGVIGASYVNRVLSTRAHCNNLWLSSEEYDFTSLREWLQDRSLDACVFLDIALENDAVTLNFVTDAVTGPVFIYDHHIVHGKPPFSRAVLANPTPNPVLPGATPLPTFAFAWALAQDSGDPFPDWLLILGIFVEGVDSFLGDDIRNLLRDTFNRLDVDNPRRAFRGTPLAPIGALIRAGFVGPEKHHGVLQTLQKIIEGTITSARELQDALRVDFGTVADAIREQIGSFVDVWQAKLQSSGELGKSLIVIPITGRLPIAGPIASILRGHFPEHVFLTWARFDDVVSLEMRTGNDNPTNLVEILQAVSRDVPLINHGGHPSGAGALVRWQDFEAAVQGIRKELSDYSCY